MSDIRLEAVSKAFGGVAALQSIDLAIPDGSRTAVVGASGSGKTTLLRLLSGFETPDAGRISIGGKVVAGPRAFVPAHRRNVGLVSQDGALFPQLTVGENVAFGLKKTPKAARGAIIDELLDMVSLDRSLAGRRPDELSGGQQQRVALARALGKRPSVMLLDEPFSALDTALRENTRQIVLDTLTSAGITTVLVTHDRAEALSFADQLAILRDGRLVQTGAPVSLYWAPADLPTAELLGDTVVLSGSASSATTAQCELGPVAIAFTELRGEVRVMLRPQQLFVSRSDGPGIGTVEATEFHGHERVMFIRLRESGKVMRLRQNHAVDVLTGDRLDVLITGVGVAFAPPPAVAVYAAS